MKVFRGTLSWDIDEASDLEAVLSEDSRGGAWFFLGDTDASYPQLAIRVSGNAADAHYLPRAGHPGIRCMAVPEQQSRQGDSTTFVYEGCDPSSGEDVPNEFVVPFSLVLTVAREFLAATRQKSASVEWFEL